jgi:uncharacterized protein
VTSVVTVAPHPIPQMTISDRLLDDMKQAMKSKDTLTLSVIRSLRSAIGYATIDRTGPDSTLDDASVIVVIRKEIKKRQDSVESYQSANRVDLADNERAEIAVLERYLPAGLSADQIAELVAGVIAELGATSKREMGAVMKLVNERAAGRADGRALSAEVSKRLA